MQQLLLLYHGTALLVLQQLYFGVHNTYALQSQSSPDLSAVLL